MTTTAPPNTPSETADAVDASVFTNLCDSLGDGADEMLPILVDDFVRDCDSALEDIRRGARDGQADLLRRAAHSLKSLAATFGGIRLASLGAQLEQRARTGQLEDLLTLVGQIEAECPPVKEAVVRLASRPRCTSV